MADLSRVLRADARRARPLAGAAVLAASGVAAAWPTLLPGVAYWDNSIVALVNAVRVMGPVAAGFAALAGARERRLDYLRVVTARSPITGVLLDLALLIMVALASYAVVAAVIVVRTLMREEAGHPDLLGLTAGSAALALHVTAGYLAGRRVPRPATALAVPAVAALWAAARLPGTSWWSLLPPAALHRVELFTTLNPGVLADQTVWATSLAVGLALAYCWWATRRNVLLLGVAAALVLAGAVTVRLHGTHGTAVQADPAEDVCHEWPLRVCVHPALAPALPALEETLTPLAARLADTPAAFTRVEQRPRPGPAQVRNGLVRVYLPGELGRGFMGGVLRDVRDGLLRPDACAGRARPPVEYESLVDAWLLGDAAPAISDRGAARRFGLWDEEDRRAWLRAHFDRYRRCSLDASDFTARALAATADGNGPDDTAVPGTSPADGPLSRSSTSAGSPFGPLGVGAAPGPGTGAGTGTGAGAGTGRGTGGGSDAESRTGGGAASSSSGGASTQRSSASERGRSVRLPSARRFAGRSSPRRTASRPSVAAEKSPRAARSGGKGSTARTSSAGPAAHGRHTKAAKPRWSAGTRGPRGAGGSGGSGPPPFGKWAGKGTRPAPDDLDQEARRGR
ncbi:hypothetical protein [Actinomadura logoneensis]|uniref:hypothetical protein n=1 Tax=Actinomadura logoneensis TaxID=2293572 RepID=UPI0018F1A67B|nr:hypothetical protein [Actinomadura logoneensis]